MNIAGDRRIPQASSLYYNSKEKQVNLSYSACDKKCSLPLQSENFDQINILNSLQCEK